MCPNKALQIHTVRKHERDMAKAKAIRQQESIKFVKRFIDPREKPLNPQTIAQLRATNEHYNTLTSVAATVDDSTFGPDDPVAFMDYFLEDIFDDEFEREFQRDMAEEVRRQRQGEVRVHINGLEAIERKEKTPFPKTNDINFPQAKFLTGLRGVKVSLASLHLVGDTE
ncbi:hypothetical protein PINS_up016150 [Pythium insidiosum]|nr:hypothetical protein PINS_up016150 [Pythium insidiosum]